LAGAPPLTSGNRFASIGPKNQDRQRRHSADDMRGAAGRPSTGGLPSSFDLIFTTRTL